MLIILPALLDADDLAAARASLLGVAWADGRPGAGAQAAKVKNNEQLPHDHASARTVRERVLHGLDRHPLFLSAALPKKVFPPRLNRYGGAANHYGNHVDGAVRFAPDNGRRVRTDLSCTVFLSDPDRYDGGELSIEEPGGPRLVKLAAGDAVLYPGTSVHQVLPVTRGERIACFFWVESMIRSGEQRRLLFEMDMALTRLRSTFGDNAETVALTGTYHNLLRMWADT